MMNTKGPVVAHELVDIPKDDRDDDGVVDQRTRELIRRIENGNRLGQRVPMADDDWVTVCVRIRHELAERHGVPYAYMTDEEKTACDFVAAQRTKELRDKYNRPGRLSLFPWAFLVLLVVLIAIVMLG